MYLSKGTYITESQLQEKIQLLAYMTLYKSI